MAGLSKSALERLAASTRTSRHVRNVPKADNAPQQTATLFDHLVRSYLQSLWDCKPECFGGFEVYNEFKLGRLQDRQIGRFFALENAGGVDTGFAPRFREDR